MINMKDGIKCWGEKSEKAQNFMKELWTDRAVIKSNFGQTYTLGGSIKFNIYFYDANFSLPTGILESLNSICSLDSYGQICMLDKIRHRLKLPP